MKLLIKIICSILILPQMAFGYGYVFEKLGAANDLINSSLPYVYKQGVVAATMAKENCSCMFVTGLAGDLERQFQERLKDCNKRITIPLKFVIEDNTRFKLVKTDRAPKAGNPYYQYKIVVENWAVNNLPPAFTSATVNVGENERKANFEVLLQRFEAVMDGNPRFGCRMRKTYDINKLGIKEVDVGYHRQTLADGSRKEGQGVFLKTCRREMNKSMPQSCFLDVVITDASDDQIQKVYTSKAEINPPSSASWPKTVDDDFPLFK